MQPSPEPELTPALRTVYGAVPSPIRLEPLAGHASSRRYYRCTVSGAGAEPRSLMVMELPGEPLGSDEASGTQGASRDELPFLEVQRLLEARGVPVPRVYASDLPRRIVLLEDLGDETFEARLHARAHECWPALYGEAVDRLAEMHDRCRSLPADHIVSRRTFDEATLRWELDHFRAWGLEAVHGTLGPDERAALDTHFGALAARLAAARSGFVHRDYQSRNLMWVPRSSHDELVVIDFQDALQGPAPYDLAALLCDSYVSLDPALQRDMLARYVRGRGLSGAEAHELEQTFWDVVVQRKLKDAGRFVFIDRVRGNPGFLDAYPQSLAYVGRALDIVEGLEGLSGIVKRRIPGFPDAVERPRADPGSASDSP